MLMVTGSPVLISSVFKVEFCAENNSMQVFAWSDYLADKCNIQIMHEMDMTPLQVSC